MSAQKRARVLAGHVQSVHAAGDSLAGRPPSGPLSGVRVVDMTQMVSGPLCGGILADQGADVIKLEAPEGDQARLLSGTMSPMVAIINRNKRSIAIDAKQPEALKRSSDLGTPTLTSTLTPTLTISVTLTVSVTLNLKLTST